MRDFGSIEWLYRLDGPPALGRRTMSFHLRVLLFRKDSDTLKNPLNYPLKNSRVFFPSAAGGKVDYVLVVRFARGNRDPSFQTSINESEDIL